MTCQAVDYIVFHRGISPALPVHGQHADTRVLHVHADNSFFLGQCAKGRRQFLLLHIHLHLGGMNAVDDIMLQHLVASDIAIGLGIDPVINELVVLHITAAVHHDANLLFNGLPQGGFNRAPLRAALTGHCHHSSPGHTGKSPPTDNRQQAYFQAMLLLQFRHLHFLPS